jgi:hypothetical protein
MYSSEMTEGSFSGAEPTVSFIQPNGKTPYTFEWNLLLDRTVGDWLFEVANIGTSERHYEERNENRLSSNARMITTRLPVCL